MPTIRAPENIITGWVINFHGLLGFKACVQLLPFSVLASAAWKPHLLGKGKGKVRILSVAAKRFWDLFLWLRVRYTTHGILYLYTKEYGPNL